MKQLYITLFAVIAIVQCSYAQWYNGTNIYNTNSGNVGIGTTTPSKLLTLSTFGSGSTVSSLLRLEQYNAGSPISGTGVAIDMAIGDNYNLPGVYGQIRTVKSNYTNSSMYFATSLSNTLTDRMVIDPYGNVGIGTTSPSYKLDVNGVINTNYYMSNAQGVYVDGGTGIGMNSSSGSLSFRTNGIDSRMMIDASGNVGIATTPYSQYKLSVNGSAIATSVTVKLYGNWPDFVFKKDYHLPTLLEVKNYIDANHHLPDVPSEKEVKDNGLNLGEINKILTKKVEELTLYLIEKDKQLKDQEARLKKLEDKFNAIAPIK